MRFAGLRVDFFGAGLRCGLVLRDRVLEPDLDLDDDVDLDALLLRDPGGEDVRVAMGTPYAGVTPVTGITGVRVSGPAGGRCTTLTAMSPLAWLLPAAPAVVDWVAVAREDRRTERWAKPAALAGLIAVAALLGAADTTTGRWLLVALTFGLVGDVALLGDSTRRFLAGLAAFLVGHLAYLVCFGTAGLPAPGWAWAVVVPLLAALVATRGVLPAAYRRDGLAVALPIAAYTAVIATMLVFAWLTGDAVVALGATVFVASDAVLSVDRFERPVPRGHVIVMVTYHLGQALVVLGLLGAT